MAEMTIQLRINPETGKKDIIVSLRGDEDALPHEHEQQHRTLVDKLIEGGLLSATEAGEVIVEREEEQHEPAAPVSTETSERESESQGG